MEKTIKSKEMCSCKAYFIIAALVAGLLVFDRLTKYLAVIFLKGTEGISLIEGVLKLEYLENHGAAFGILENKQFIFLILTTIFIAAAIYFFIRIPKTKYYLPLIITAGFLLSGALGNFIDRIINGYVVDFIYFEIINFPIFNLADIYVSLSVAALLIMVIFHYKEGDFRFLSFKKKKDNE